MNRTETFLRVKCLDFHRLSTIHSKYFQLLVQLIKYNSGQTIGIENISLMFAKQLSLPDFMIRSIFFQQFPSTSYTNIYSSEACSNKPSNGLHDKCSFMRRSVVQALAYRIYISQSHIHISEEFILLICSWCSTLYSVYACNRFVLNKFQ